MPDKVHLLAEIKQTWEALNDALLRLSKEQMATLYDAQGWNVKDHLVHLSCWERSVVFMLQGKPRHAGLRVDEALYLTEDFDKINAVIHQQEEEVSLPEVLAQLRDVHRQMLELLQPMTDADLQLPYRHFLPDEPGEGDGPTAYEMVYANTAGHFSDHLEWIEAIV